MYCVECGKIVPEGAKFCKYCGARVVVAPNYTGEYEQSGIQQDGAQWGGAQQDGVQWGGMQQNESQWGGMQQDGAQWGGMQQDGAQWSESQWSQAQPRQGMWQEEPKKQKSGKRSKKLVVLLIAVILLLAAAVAYSTVGLAMEKDNLVSEIEAADIGEYEDQTETLKERWETLGITDLSEKRRIIKELKTEKEEMFAANDAYVKEKLEFYESLDLQDADESVKKNYETKMKSIKKLEKDDYKAYQKAFQKMNEIVYMYIDPENILDISVQQVDASEFPKIKLYLSVKDDATGDVPDDLDKTLFYINKKDANAKYIKQVISSVNQLNEKEALKIDMVADVSGSMDGSPIREAKEVMSNFIDSVQFDAGDMVELTSFATGVRLEEEFTDDESLLKQDVYGLTIGDMTSLYDALYTAVERAASQTGARCVIAFTDGQDNYSNCTVDDVISIAQRYHIPVFIIGIGDIDYSDVSRIAAQTGGSYYNINEIYSLEDIYDEIYRMEKELYLVEYEDETGAAVTDAADIQVGYRSPKYGGECEYTYTPNTLLSVDAATLYKDGPESVVEQYIKHFDDAMTNQDYSYISKYLLSGSSIAKEQQAYVKRGYTEQLDSYEIVSTSYSDSNNCVVTTRETYYVQKQNAPLQLMTQQCQYAVTKNGSDWKITAFAGKIQVLSRINQ